METVFRSCVGCLYNFQINYTHVPTAEVSISTVSSSVYGAVSVHSVVLWFCVWIQKMPGVSFNMPQQIGRSAKWSYSTGCTLN